MAYATPHDDGARLALGLAHFADQRPFVLAIPRGGVLIAETVARALGAPLDVLIAGKVLTGAGVALGAIAEGGVLIVDDAAVAAHGVDPAELDRLVDRERARQDTLLERIRGSWPLPALAGRTVLLIDDALITGLTVRAAIAALKSRGVKRIVVAAPLGAREEEAVLAAGAHEVVLLRCLPRDEAARAHADDRGKPCPPLGDAEIHDLVARELREIGADPFADLALDGI